MKLHLGCGFKYLEGYVNVDIREDSCADVVVDVITYLHLRELCSVTEIRASHLIEHLTKVQGQEFLKECGRVLVPEGMLYLDLPLIDYVIDYCWKGGNVNHQEIINILYGLQRYQGDQHQYGYTSKTISILLDECGFQIFEIEQGRPGKPHNKNSVMLRCKRKPYE